jgi:hypothetical protein
MFSPRRTKDKPPEMHRQFIDLPTLLVHPLYMRLNLAERRKLPEMCFDFSNHLLSRSIAMREQHNSLLRIACGSIPLQQTDGVLFAPWRPSPHLELLSYKYHASGSCSIALAYYSAIPCDSQGMGEQA